MAPPKGSGLWGKPFGDRFSAKDFSELSLNLRDILQTRPQSHGPGWRDYGRGGTRNRQIIRLATGEKHLKSQFAAVIRNPIIASITGTVSGPPTKSVGAMAQRIGSQLAPVEGRSTAGQHHERTFPAVFSSRTSYSPVLKDVEDKMYRILEYCTVLLCEEFNRLVELVESTAGGPQSGGSGERMKDPDTGRFSSWDQINRQVLTELRDLGRAVDDIINSDHVHIEPKGPKGNMIFGFTAVQSMYLDSGAPGQLQDMHGLDPLESSRGYVQDIFGALLTRFPTLSSGITPYFTKPVRTFVPKSLQFGVKRGWVKGLGMVFKPLPGGPDEGWQQYDSALDMVRSEYELGQFKAVLRMLERGEQKQRNKRKWKSFYKRHDADTLRMIYQEADEEERAELLEAFGYDDAFFDPVEGNERVDPEGADRQPGESIDDWMDRIEEELFGENIDLGDDEGDKPFGYGL